MRKMLTLITGLGLGAALMYVFDPDKGRRRRALARDKADHVLHKAGDLIQRSRRRTINRVTGMLAGVRARLTAQRVDDDVLVGRVRSRMGRVVSHPGLIQVTADNGRVALRGRILAIEADALLRCVESVTGVVDVENKLVAYVWADDGTPSEEMIDKGSAVVEEQIAKSVTARG
jgi:hypothetical protein